MTIYNTNGLPYVPSGSIQQFDPGNPDTSFLQSVDMEGIHAFGSPIYYYERFSSGNIDYTYREDRSELWSQIPLMFFGYYEPIASTNNLGVFGIDAADELMITCNYKEVLGVVNHVPKIGSRIFTPQLRENWEIIQCNLSEMKLLWQVYHIELILRRFQESKTNSSSVIPQPTLPYNVLYSI